MIKLWSCSKQRA